MIVQNTKRPAHDLLFNQPGSSGPVNVVFFIFTEAHVMLSSVPYLQMSLQKKLEVTGRGDLSKLENNGACSTGSESICHLEEST